MSGISLYWHDYETFGVDPRRDSPVQFAGLRTDENLDPIGDPTEIFCHPPRDRLPSPEACLVTGITPQTALERGVCEAEFARAIHAELSQSGTCGLGYNTLRFDDEVTRNLFYRNFYDPYEREWRNGNSRWDIIDALRLAAALRPGGIEWPRDDQGRPSFRLELLTAANGIGHGNAHDALADVKATINLARLLKSRQPRLYDFVWRNRGKREAAFLLNLGGYQPVLHVSEKYPAEQGCIAVVVALARHPVNQNEIAVFDLNADPEPLLVLSAEDIRLRLFTRAANLPEGMERIPLKTVHLNRCPVLVPLNTLRPADADRLGVDLARCQAHLARLKESDGLESKLQAVFVRLESESSDREDPDAMIYSGGFFSDADKFKLSRLREMSPEQLASAHPDFDDRRLPEMLFRYRARNYPHSLSAEEKDRWENFRRTRLTDKSFGSSLVLKEYEMRLNELEAQFQAQSRQAGIIEQLRNWGQMLAA